ncbi:MAG: GTPase domain-containing protein [Deltaproteobacteria bacterium]|nr:GTPase domain-containing protein [Deltaproteobacteria bacterium]
MTVSELTSLLAELQGETRWLRDAAPALRGLLGPGPAAGRPGGASGAGGDGGSRDPQALLAGEDPAWSQFLAHAEQLALFKYPVAVLFGPSGAGKSSFFRTFSGLPVPVSPAIRPTTFASLASVPGDLRENEVAGMFPGFRVAPLDPDQASLSANLGDPATPAGLLFFTPGRGPALPLVLVDVPDFNTVETLNRQKAEAMVRRAEVVLFLVYKEGYADERTVEQLLFCCQRAAMLLFLLTKTTPEEGRAIWPDLLAKLSRRDDFAGRRPDGRSAYEFLARATAYASPPLAPGETPTALPLDPAAPPLAEALQSRSPRHLQLESLHLALEGGREAGERLVARVAERASRLAGLTRRLEAGLREEFLEAGLQEFPIGDMFITLSNLAHEELKERNWATRALYYLNLPGRKAAERLRKRLGDQEAAFQKLKAAEGEGVRRHAAQLAKTWRVLALEEPELFQGLGGLDEPRVHRYLDHLLEVPLPPLPPDWNSILAEICRQWMADNSSKALQLSVLSGTITAVMGGVFVTVDVLLGGPLTSTLLAGPAGAVVGQLMGQLIVDYQLEMAVRQAHESWRKARGRQLVAHTREHFARPLLLDPVAAKIAELEGGGMARFQEGLARLGDDLTRLAGLVGCC